MTGLSVLASRNSLYIETGWEPLVIRRDKAKLLTMFKIHNNLAPDYLKNIVPMVRNSVSNYNTRNSFDYSLPKCRLELYNKSFVPDTVRKWNSLSNETREITSIGIFKRKLSNNNDKPPKYFSYGKRYLNILHTKLRHNCILNNDLYRCNIISNPNCSCGMKEDSHHFFFVCRKYFEPRRLMMNALLLTYNVKMINVHKLLWGDDSLSSQENEKIFGIVQKFIQESGRFN